MKSHCAGNAPGIFRLAENGDLDLAVSEKVDVVVLNSGPAYIRFDGIKADTHRVSGPDRRGLEGKVVQQPDELAAGILVDV
jgi:hypothetical protein